MIPTHSVTFTIDGPHFAETEAFSIPFLDEKGAQVYADNIGLVWPDAANIVVNDLAS